MSERVLMFCPRCGYKWFSKTKMKYIICPRCRAHRRREIFVREGGK